MMDGPVRYASFCPPSEMQDERNFGMCGGGKIYPVDWKVKY
jgi:hypothetical protein